MRTLSIFAVCVVALLVSACASGGSVRLGYNTYTAEVEALDRDSMGYIIRR